MEPETETVIDVEAELIDNFEPDSTEEWYSALQIQGLLRVSNAGLQQSIFGVAELRYDTGQNTRGNAKMIFEILMGDWNTSKFEIMN